MLYSSGEEWRDAASKRVMLFGMSGLGKTHLSALLRASGGWFHFSADYRIGTRYMGEHIADNFKREAMKVPLLRDLLMTDSVYIASNITFSNLAPLSTYLGKPGDPAKGGLPWPEYLRRQEQHREAEARAMLDVPHFAERARAIYGYSNFVCDASGSLCEVVDPGDPDDPIMSALSAHVLPVWIEGTEAHADALRARFDRDPKPMCYGADFLEEAWADYLLRTDDTPEAVDPDAFIRWAFARAVAHRRPRYAAIAGRWGVTVAADDVARIGGKADFLDLVAGALDR